MLEFACKDLVFHFNKKHLEDDTIPMWVLKFHGETYYINHVDCRVPWNTKETPDNNHTKGSIKIKDCLLTIDDENCAKIAELNVVDKFRLRNQKLGITRVILGQRDISRLRDSLKQFNIKHGPIKAIGGACSSTFYITDVLDKTQMTMLSLNMSNTSMRILMPNESYYKVYDDPKYKFKDFIDEDSIYDDDDED